MDDSASSGPPPHAEPSTTAELERELAASEERYACLAQAVTDYVYFVRVEGGRPVETRHGPGCVGVTGYSTDEFAADPHLWIRMVPSEDRGKILEQVRRILAGAQADAIEHRIVRKGGDARWVINTPVPHRDAGGALVGYDGLIRDVTERKLTDERLRQSEERYRKLFDTSNSALFILGKGGLFVDFNRVALERYGYSDEELRRMTPADLAAPDLRGKALGRVAEAAVDVTNFEWCHATKDGREIPVEITTRPFEIDGRTFVFAEVRDITVRKRVEESLRLAERQYEALFEELLDGFAVAEVVFDDRGAPVDYRLAALNPAFERMTGLETARIVGRTVLELFPAVDRTWLELCGSVATQGRPVHFEGYSRALNFHFETTVFQPMLGQIACIVANVSERKRLEDQCRQSQKMEAVGRLAGGVAHDLNNMLTPILAYTEMLEDAFAPDDTRLQPIRQVRAAGVRAKDLVHQLLAFSRKQTLKFKVVDINAVISGLEPLLRRTVRENIVLRLGLAPSLPGVRGDVGQIEQAIMNLAINAQDAMPEGGVLAIETIDVTLGVAQAAAQADVAPGWYVEMAISDTGVGMDAAVMERIFEPFFTTKAVGKGTGLGLATVYGIVKQHGGSVTVRSELGAGATFKLNFPALEDAVPAVANEDASPAVDRGARVEVIMVAEDDDLVRDLAAGVLRRQGYTVLTAANAEECVKQLAGRNGPLHLLLTDVVMPDMNGKALYDIVSTIAPDTRVIYMSGYSQEVISEHGVLLENIDFLEKPFTVRQLVAKVRTVLDRGRA